jgi:xanthine dehydrogenase accessory factor
MSGLPRDWLPTLVKFLDREPVVVRIAVAEVRGSTPREPGAFMLVGRDSVEGSIGGGQLEWEAIAGARELLADTGVAARVNKVVLGADVGQCCGGVVSVWLERFTRESLGLLHTASDAGARGHAVLSSTVRGCEVEHRVVRRSGTGGSGIVATAAGTTAGASAIAATAAGPTADTSTVVATATTGDARAVAATATARGAGAIVATTAPTAADAGIDETTDRLLREPRQRALPILTHNAAGEPTFLERLDDEFPAVWLYGAGHVGQALARILTELPLRLTWVDSRAELFPDTIGGGARILHDPDSLATVSEAPVGAYFIVMSHSHPLDYSLCHALLERNDFAWLGLIGSASKAARFRSRLKRAGLGADVIRKLVCPIGVDGIESKWPAAIAVAVAAQLMQQISAVGVGRPEPLIERHDSRPPRAETAQADGARSDSACSPENCATCGSPAAHARTVTS